MTTANSVTSTVDVPVDPRTAFTAFTEELDCWWIQGPINFFDAARAYYMRVEPGVGGRIVEVYDEATGEGMEVARITEWAPPDRLAWQSAVDDVSIEVSFDGIDTGTRVQVRATIPDGGADNGGTAWIRMVPVWFGSWFAKRERDGVRAPLRMSRLAVAVHYAKPKAAARWLRDVFRLDPAGDIPDDDADEEHVWIEFHVGNASVMVFGGGGEAPGHPTHTPWVFVDDLDAHYAHAKGNGAHIVDEIWEHGARAYGAADLEGNHWTFAQAPPLMR